VQSAIRERIAPLDATRIGIVVSLADAASVHIGEKLLELRDWTRIEGAPDQPVGGARALFRCEGFDLRTFDSPLLDLEDVSEAFEHGGSAESPARLVFASRHAGETGALLTAHFTGNIGSADHGGSPNELAAAAPHALKHLVSALETHAPDGYDVGVECTHHGPSSVGVPSLFVELGSDEQQYRDPAGARAVAKAILDLQQPDTEQRDQTDSDQRTVVAFGGGHYAPRPTRIVQETDWAVGHICADWALDELEIPDVQPEGRDSPLENALTPAFETVVQRLFVQSNAALGVVAGDQPRLEAAIEALGYRVVSETWLRETTGVARSLVDSLEETLSPVSEGLRFGDVATDYDGSIGRQSLPDDLLRTSHTIDSEATFDAVESTTIAFETTNGATIPAGRAAIDPDTALSDALCRSLVPVLETRFESVERTPDEIVARETQFDPEKASTLGIEAGPKFGQLADGNPVTINGERIHPDVVTTERSHRFPL